MQSIKSTALEPTAVELESMSLPQKIGGWPRSTACRSAPCS